jgi:C-terminal processing protease CtpA/Prc
MKKLNWIIGLVMIMSSSCTPDEDVIPQPESNLVKAAIFDSMKEWYYWNDELPATINTSDYTTNQDLLRAIIYKPLDRFSYLTTRNEFNNAFVGKNAGHGFGFGFDRNERLFLTSVFKDSPAGKDGWQRGWEITNINGKPISAYKTSTGGYEFQLGPSEAGLSNTFTFLLPDGSSITRTNTKTDYQSNSVLHQEIITAGTKIIGYWVYNSFKATEGLNPTQSKEVGTSMDYFQSESINELIIDLRYNGGGSVAVAEQINNYLIQSSNSGKVMYTNQLNSLKTDLEKTVNFKKIGNLELDRIIFITSRGTASASELVINSLKPYTEIVLVGDNTFGKPVGSFPLSGYNKTLKENNVELVPITFATANAVGNTEYFDGFPVDYVVGDTPQFNWGNSGDLRLRAALNYLENGAIGARMEQSYYKPVWEMIDAFSGLRQEFPAY